MQLKREIPGINSSSSADIAFLLLIFFLLTSSIAREKTVNQLLPEKQEPQTPSDIKKRDVFELSIQADNSLVNEGNMLNLKELKICAERFIMNPDDEMTLPEKLPVVIPLVGKQQLTSNHLFIIRIHPASSYQQYVRVQHAIISTYDKLREDFSVRKWGRHYVDLTASQQQSAQQVYPCRIAEMLMDSDEKGGIR
ncbi:MAG: biopolymer transporter ExbD [Bacteroidales bacterium]|jgi:biopolymer transport protein ExbD|nr:biopolymer transporter ExbD [Bacteroidales bacterium]